MCRDGAVAVAADRGEECPLGRDRGCGRRLVDGGEKRPRRTVVGAAFERERALADGGQELVDRERLSRGLADPEPREPRRGEQECIDLTGPPFSQASVDVAAEEHHHEVGAVREELRPPPRARRPDTRAGRQAGEPPVAADEHVAGVSTLGYRADHEPGGKPRRHVLHRVHARVDPAVEQGFLDLLHEEPLAARRSERSRHSVAGRPDEDQLHREARMARRERGADALGLHPRQRARARAEPQPAGSGSH